MTKRHLVYVNDYILESTVQQWLLESLKYLDLLCIIPKPTKNFGCYLHVLMGMG